MERSDVIIIGGGLIGLSLAWELTRKNNRVVVLERREPGMEASHAGGGMIADLDPVLPSALQELATYSAQLYPEFVRDLQAAANLPIDLRENGVIAFEEHAITVRDGIRAITMEEARKLEPALASISDPAYFMAERAVDPRDLVNALLAVLRRTPEVHIASGTAAAELIVEHGRAVGVRTERSEYRADRVVNCAGAWASEIGPAKLPTHPVKGHMVALVFPHEVESPVGNREKNRVLRHVLRSRWCYVIPRTNGRYVVGSTVEPGGFDKSVNAYRVKRLQQSAARLIPSFSEARIAEAWTGLRPGTPDNLPLLGETSIPGYFAATGHYRDGILLAPGTARIIAAVLAGEQVALDIERFSPKRF